MAREAVIVSSTRTGLAKAHRGSFNQTEPVDYLAHTLKSVVEKVDVDPATIEDVITGVGIGEGCQGMNMSRMSPSLIMPGCQSMRQPKFRDTRSQQLHTGFTQVGYRSR